ncbi:NADH-quinone oxidoreductase subunit NuoE [Candidatus Nitrotoga sp. M5]|uniref:NADH-quinone oxidoreductase subunit NuoE n=1 Tax=Candidatus Nitrotoga sp. M5 TaxID=2890409 RepID=UPI001EF398AC|nr:NAD(P)H-dependent oxidoreductase subunit E [Candidatus Nitrotoga sp. M5]CAH1386035.1 NADH-quinone oxidoreductase subunit E [Candidatus Nitrotoga sp. M5]
MLSEQVRAKTDHELKKYPPDRKQSAVMAALRFVQDEKGWISTEDMADVASYLCMPQISVYEVATFYNMYNLKPMGRHTLTVCTNLSCQLVGATETLNYIKSKLDIEVGEVTADGKFGLLEGECQNVCDEAPLFMINNKKTCGNLTKEKIDQILAELDKE